MSLMAGVVINDADGEERFGLGLQDSGVMTMGFDAPPGTGDDRNRERIAMGADAEDGSFLHVLNCRTARVVLTAEDEGVLEFLDVTAGSVVGRRIGREAVRWPATAVLAEGTRRVNPDLTGGTG